ITAAIGGAAGKSDQLDCRFRACNKKNNSYHKGTPVQLSMGYVPNMADDFSCHILFVCTGNTCRSPLAQAMCARLLADRLGCEPADLPARGFSVQSAGLAAMIGAEATAEAVAVAREMGADLSGHKSQPLTRELLAQTDLLFTMTQAHLHILNS